MDTIHEWQEKSPWDDCYVPNEWGVLFLFGRPRLKQGEVAVVYGELEAWFPIASSRGTDGVAYHHSKEELFIYKNYITGILILIVVLNIKLIISKEKLPV